MNSVSSSYESSNGQLLNKMESTPKKMLNKIKEMVVSLSVFYERQKYLEVKNKLLQFISEINDNERPCSNPLNNSMNINNEYDDESERKTFKLFLPEEISQFKISIFRILQFISNNEDVFYSNDNRSIMITLDLLIAITKYKVLFQKIEDKFFKISLFNKILCIFKIFPPKDILDSIYEDFILSTIKELNEIEEKECLSYAEIMINKYQAFQNEILNCITKNKNCDKTMSSNHSEMSNSSFSKSSFDIIPTQKMQIKNSLHDSTKLMEFYLYLSSQSSILDNIEEEKERPLYTTISNLNMTYLILFSKIVDELDKPKKFQKYVKELFLNKVLRSKTFINFIQQSLVFDNSQIVFKNKNIYIERYLDIGNLIIKSLNINHCNDPFQVYGSIYKNILNKLDVIFDSFKDLESPPIKFNYSHSDYHLFFYCLMKNHKIFQNCFTYLSINIEFENEERGRFYFKLLKEQLGKYQQISNIRFHDNKQSQFILFDLDIQKKCSFFIENNQNEIQRCEKLGQIIFANPLYLTLFIAIKIWAVQQKLFIDYELNDQIRFFDESVLLYFVYYYLINCGKLETYKNYENKFKDKVKYYVNDISNIQKNNLKNLGELYVNFFYFMLELINSANELSFRGEKLFISLNSYRFLIKKDEDNELKAINQFAIKSHRKIGLILQDFLPEKKNSCFMMYDTKQMKKLSKELTRMLHILLDEDKKKLIFSVIKTYSR